jgi:hypothetical protein
VIGGVNSLEDAMETFNDEGEAMGGKYDSDVDP